MNGKSNSSTSLSYQSHVAHFPVGLSRRLFLFTRVPRGVRVYDYPQKGCLGLLDAEGSLATFTVMLVSRVAVCRVGV
jgi:hypothetical protein